MTRVATRSRAPSGSFENATGSAASTTAASAVASSSAAESAVALRLARWIIAAQELKGPKPRSRASESGVLPSSSTRSGDAPAVMSLLRQSTWPRDAAVIGPCFDEDIDDRRMIGVARHGQEMRAEHRVPGGDVRLCLQEDLDA
eukprot:190572-Prymnesium_polylepis.1